jgi:hypothetical protein
MHARTQAVGVLTLSLLFFGIAAAGEDSVVTQQDVPIVEPAVEETFEPVQEEFSSSETVALPPPTLYHAGCPTGFEESWSVLPQEVEMPDGTATTYWPACNWYDSDTIDFPGCPEYGDDVLFRPTCYRHFKQPTE